jgi:hypothetical protein
MDTQDTPDIIKSVAQVYKGDVQDLYENNELSSTVSKRWTGTREHLTEMATNEVIEVLSTPRVFEEMKLREMDHIIIDDAGQPVVHIHRQPPSYLKEPKDLKKDEKVIIVDVDDVEKVTELVETVKARQRRNWFTAMGGVVAALVAAKAVTWWWKRK